MSKLDIDTLDNIKDALQRLKDNVEKSQREDKLPLYQGTLLTIKNYLLHYKKQLTDELLDQIKKEEEGK